MQHYASRRYFRQKVAILGYGLLLSPITNVRGITGVAYRFFELKTWKTEYVLSGTVAALLFDCLCSITVIAGYPYQPLQLECIASKTTGREICAYFDFITVYDPECHSSKSGC